MSRFKIGDKIAKVRKVKQTGRIVEQLQTGVITSECFIEDKHEHYIVDWDFKDGETITYTYTTKEQIDEYFRASGPSLEELRSMCLTMFNN